MKFPKLSRFHETYFPEGTELIERPAPPAPMSRRKANAEMRAAAARRAELDAYRAALIASLGDAAV